MGPHLSLVSLCGHNQHRGARQVAPDLTNPFVLQVQEGGMVGHRVAHQYHVCLLVGQGTDASEGIIAGGVPETQADLDAIHEDVHARILINSGFVGLREGLRGEAHQ